MTNIRAIKESILTRRKAKGITQKDMAKRLSISQPAYSYYEKGNKPLPVNQLEKVLDILDLDITNLPKEKEPLDKISDSLESINIILEKIYEKL